jgi:hypothetical protein
MNCDGILGRDFLRQTQAQICYYKTGTLTFQYGGLAAEKKKLISEEGECINPEEGKRGVKTVTLPRRSEILVKLPVARGTTPTEGLIEKREIQ